MLELPQCLLPVSSQRRVPDAVSWQVWLPGAQPDNAALLSGTIVQGS